MSRQIKIAVADDQAMFRSGLVSLLNNIEEFEVIIEAADGKELIDLLRGKQPDVAIIDYRMPNINGINAAKLIKEKYPSVRILMLSMYDNEEFIISAIENGANGYLTKDDEPDEIQKAIHSVLTTGYYANDRTSRILIEKLMLSGKITPVFPDQSKQEQLLSDSQLEIVHLIAKEMSTKEIAQKLNKSERSIEKTRARIMEKIGAKNSIGIIMYAIKNKLLDVNS